jgi:hypothetical protein
LVRIDLDMDQLIEQDLIRIELKLIRLNNQKEKTLIPIIASNDSYENLKVYFENKLIIDLNVKSIMRIAKNNHKSSIDDVIDVLNGLRNLESLVSLSLPKNS